MIKDTVYLGFITVMLLVTGLVGCDGLKKLEALGPKFAKGECITLDLTTLEAWEQPPLGMPASAIPTFVVMEVGKHKYRLMTTDLAAGLQQTGAKFKEVEENFIRTRCPQE